MYKPKLVKGRVKNTGWPIDGHELIFSQWDYDNHESWHLAGYYDSSEEALMKTLYQTEVAEGWTAYDSWEEFEAAWKDGAYESDGVFCLELDQVEVLKVLQEEQMV